MKIRILERLGARVMAMLSIALLPLGVIAVVQTKQVVEQAEELSRSVLHGSTLAAAESQSDLIHEGFAAARVLGGAIMPLLNEEGRCDELLNGFVRAHPAYSLASFVPKDGVSTCNSRGVPFDLRASATYRDMSREMRPLLYATDRGRITGQSALIIGQPMFQDGAFIGYMSLSLPRRNLELVPEFPADRQPIDFITLNSKGDILMSTNDFAQARGHMPAFRDISSYIYRRSTSFTADDQNGTPRIYSVVPVVPGVVFALAVWDEDADNPEVSFINRSALIFPLLMWLVSLAVAYVAVHRLVIRHIRTLRTKMRLFGSGDSNIGRYALAESAAAPAELRQMEETFDSMAERITRDTAELENNLHEKNMLLKEVHHRVKNNLQLIASIMNMEIRKTKVGETRSTLRRVQDRVMGLATVHSNLYHTSRLASIRADNLLSDVVRQTLKSALPSDGSVTVDLNINEVILDPEQAVPLSLLATEATTNAIKYLGRPGDKSKPWIRVDLLRNGDDTFTFRIANSRGTPLDLRDEPESGSGLGQQLIDAFAMQLGSRVQIDQDDESYALSVNVVVSGTATGKT